MMLVAEAGNAGMKSGGCRLLHVVGGLRRLYLEGVVVHVDPPRRGPVDLAGLHDREDLHSSGLGRRTRTQVTGRGPGGDVTTLRCGGEGEDGCQRRHCASALCPTRRSCSRPVYPSTPPHSPKREPLAPGGVLIGRASRMRGRLTTTGGKEGEVALFVEVASHSQKKRLGDGAGGARCVVCVAWCAAAAAAPMWRKTGPQKGVGGRERSRWEAKRTVTKN